MPALSLLLLQLLLLLLFTYDFTFFYSRFQYIVTASPCRRGACYSGLYRCAVLSTMVYFVILLANIKSVYMCIMDGFVLIMERGSDREG